MNSEKLQDTKQTLENQFYFYMLNSKLPKKIKKSFVIALKRINGLEVNSTNEVKDTYTGIFKTLMNDIK